MDQRLQKFAAPLVDKAGDVYDIYLHGRSRPGDTWQGWLVFERRRDGESFATDVETTQPNEDAVLYWATGLTDTYLDGALKRAQSSTRQAERTVVTPAPVVSGAEDATTRAARLADVERQIIAFFFRRRMTRVLTDRLFDELPHAHADVVRALEDLEKQRRFLVRKTEKGSDWLLLTEEGVQEAGLKGVRYSPAPEELEPPKSAR